jgi:hypothetical protein
MAEFWAFEDWMVSRARVHRGDCVFCDHGRGIHGGGTGQNSAWHGPYSSRGEAGASCSRVRNPRSCHWCLPGG